MRSAVEQRIQNLTVQLAHLPETSEIQQLQNDCERECTELDDGLFDSDSVNTSEVDSSDFSSENESPEAVRWRARLERRYALFMYWLFLLYVAMCIVFVICGA